MYQPPKPSEKFACLSDAQLEASIRARRGAVAAMQHTLEQLQNDLMRDLEQVDALGEEQVRRELSAAAAAGAKPNWARLLELVPFNSSTKYDAALAMLKEGLPAEACDLISLAGSTNDAKQHLVQIALVRGAPHLTAALAARLHEILPAVRLQARAPLEDDERPYKRISLVEKSLSRDASYYLAINEDAGMYQVRACTYGRAEVVKNCGNLNTLLKLVEEKYYYRDASA